MNETKWTPGPWEEVPDKFYVRAADDETFVADCNGMHGDDTTDEANARLIAAAPDLYAALEGLDAAYCRAGDGLTKAERREDRMRLTAARTALAKARGE